MLVSVVIGFATTFGIPFTDYKGTYGHEKVQVLKYLNLVADLKKERLEIWLNEVKSDVRTLASNETLANVFQQSTPGSERTSETTHEERQKRVPVTKLFQEVLRAYPRYSRILLADSATGRILVSTKEDETNAAISHFKSFEKAASQPGTLAVEVERDPLDDTTYLIAAKSVRWSGDISNRERAPILLVYVYMENFVRPMLYVGEGLGETGEILLVSQERAVLMSLKYPLADGSRARVLEHKIGAPPARLAAQGGTGIIEAHDYRGVPVLAAYRFVPIVQNQGWGMVVKQDAGEVFAPLWKQIESAIVVGIGAIVLVTMAGLWTGTRISRPIRVLSQTAEEVSRGNLAARSEVKGPPEIEALSRTFNSLIDHVQNWHDELARQVDLRTKELKAANEQLAQEIVERKRIEAELRENEQRFRYLFEKAPVPLHSVDASFNIIHVSDNWLELLGYERSEVIGRRPTDFLTEESRREAEDHFIPHFLETGKVKDVPYRMVKRNGEVIDVLLSSSARRDEGGNYLQSLTAFYDVTELRRAERALQQAHDELEMRVSERTADLARANAELALRIQKQKETERELREALAGLSASNEELSQFAYVSSHDLQEPLRNVITTVQIFEKRYCSKLDSDADRLIRYTVEAADRAIKLIRDLLVYSRIGGSKPSFEPVDLEDALHSCVEDLGSLVQESSASITHDPLPTVIADKIQVEQVLRNLLSNALKFRGKEPPSIHVSCEEHERMWHFSVSDNGIGIEKEYFDRIFLIFKRLHPPSQYGGTGIGLTIAKKIVESHGGKIWLESEPNKGTTFYFSLPKG